MGGVLLTWEASDDNSIRYRASSGNILADLPSLSSSSDAGGEVGSTSSAWGNFFADLAVWSAAEQRIRDENLIRLDAHVKAVEAEQRSDREAAREAELEREREAELEREDRRVRESTPVVEEPHVHTPVPAPHVHTPVPAGGPLRWPYQCQISRGFSGGHTGIDIDGICNTGAVIVSAQTGTVTSAGWDGGYGYSVTVSGGGMMTRYAHLSQIYVSVGQQLNAGASLGVIGCTGSCTGTHLHFEVWVSGSAQNPLGFL